MPKSSRRMLRGLVWHMRFHKEGRAAGGGRQLIMWANRWQDKFESPDGYCRWCKLPIGKERRKSARWHSDCQRAYYIAAGDHFGAIPLGACAAGCGKPAHAIDHRLAISVARELGDKALMRAFTLENLQALCRDCHANKTRVDALTLRAIKGLGMDYNEALSIYRGCIERETRQPQLPMNMEV